MDCSALIAQYFSSTGRELEVDGVGICDIAEEYGTPLFVYSSAVLESKWRVLRESLPDRFSIYYSVKANPNRTILSFFLNHGCGLEIASGGEYFQARAAGCPGERIVYAGPGKTEAELEEVLKGGVGEIHAESEREIQRIQMISSRLGVRACVAIRVNPTADAEGGAMRMGGKPAAFGIDEEFLDDVLCHLQRAPAIAFSGIHLFSGTQILDQAVLLRQYRKGLEIAKRIDKGGTRVRTLDFGGGLGIPYFAYESPLDMKAFHAGLRELLAEITDNELIGTRFVVEPGRFLVGECGVYLTRVLDVKISRGKQFVVTDGGMNHHLAASGNLGQTIKRNYPIAVVNKLTAEPVEEADIVGPLCTPLDVIGRSVRIPRMKPGDLIGVFQSGAYARAASPLNFLSHVSPAEALVNDGRARLIRRRGEYSNYLEDQC